MAKKSSKKSNSDVKKIEIEILKSFQNLDNKKKDVKSEEKIKTDYKIEENVDEEIDSKLKKNKKFKREKKKLVNIFTLIFLIFLFLFICIIGKVVYIEITHNVPYIDIGEGLNVGQVDLEEYANQQYTHQEVIPSDRGIIYDSNNDPLAVNIETYKIIAHLDKDYKTYDSTKQAYVSNYVENPEETADKLIKDLGYEDNPEAKEVIYSQLSQNSDKVSQVEFGEYGENVSLEEKEAIEKDGIKGIEFEPKTQRYYPYGDFASYVLGYATVDEDNQLTGELGVEKLLNDYLEGQDGEKFVSKDNNGITNGKVKEIKPKIDGADVHLTINSVIQSFVHDSMEKYLSKEDFDQANTIVMDAKTGKILAAESMPSFNPNLKNVTNYTDPFYNTCVEPGSTMKTFLVATAIDKGVWNPNNVVETGKREDSKWGNMANGQSNYIADWLYNDNGRTWGNITWEQGYYFSSNVAMTYILDSVGYDTWEDAVTNVYQFGQPLSNQLMTSESCDYSPEYNFETATTSFGQGMTASIMQLLQGYSTFANDGKMVMPYFVESINDSETGEEIYTGVDDYPSNWKKGKDGVNVDPNTGQYYKEILTPQEASEVRDLMKGVMSYDEGGDFYGTGKYYQEGVDYEIGGKTGTAEVAVDGSYDNASSLYSVMILAPIDDPQIVYYTTVSNPTSTFPQDYMSKYTASILNNTLNYLNQQKSEKSNKDVNNEKNFEKVENPNFIGMTEEEVEKTANKKSLKYKYIGNGKVVKQYPEANSFYIKNGEVLLLGENYDIQDFIGLNEEDAENYCYLLNVNCEIAGKGNVESIEKIEKENKYVVKLS